MKRLIKLLTIPIILFINEIYGQVFVVVNSQNPINNITISQLKEYYLGEKEYWDVDGFENSTITLTDYTTDNELTQKFYKTILGISQSTLRLVWMGKMLNGEIRNFPINKSNQLEIIKVISQNPYAIGFISDKSIINKNRQVKQLDIENFSYKDKSYPLQ